MKKLLIFTAAGGLFRPEPHCERWRRVCFWPILLQKSFCTGDQKFCGLQVRLSCKDVRDLIASR